MLDGCGSVVEGGCRVVVRVSVFRATAMEGDMGSGAEGLLGSGVSGDEVSDCKEEQPQRYSQPEQPCDPIRQAVAPSQANSVVPQYRCGHAAASRPIFSIALHNDCLPRVEKDQRRLGRPTHFSAGAAGSSFRKRSPVAETAPAASPARDRRARPSRAFLAVFLVALALEVVWLSAIGYGIYLLIRVTG
jgi:hypothetical protein